MPPTTTRRLPSGVVLAASVAGALLVFLAFFYFFGGWRESTSADLILCNGDEPQSLDPAIVTGQLEGRICLALFEGLTTRDAKGAVIPGMAEKWEMTPDGLTYTFHLRPGIKWSNGDPLTAYDFLNSWKRALEPATGAQYAYQLYYLVNAEAYGTGKLKDFSQVGVKAPDDHTLVVTLVHPTAYFLELTSFQTLCPVHLPTVQKYGSEWTKPGNMVSDGPYTLKVWRLNDYLLVESNPYYYRPVAVHRIKVLPTSSPTACFNLFYSRKTDLILDTRSIPSELVSDIAQEPYFHANPFGATSFMRFNVKRKPFDDVRVRRALSMAIDKQDIVTKIVRQSGIVANTLVPPGTPGYTPPEGMTYNVQEARKLLAEAGYPNGQGFPPVQLLYAKRGSSEQVSSELQALWKRDLNIDIGLRAQEWKVYLNTQELMDYDLTASAWIGDYNDPQTFIDMFVTGGGNNLTGWSDPQYDQMLATSENEPDPAKRMQIMHDMEKILIEDEAPIAPIYFWVGMSLYRPEKVGGFEPNFVDDHRWGQFFLQGKSK